MERIVKSNNGNLRPKIICLVVLYRTPILESETIQSLLEQDKSFFDYQLIIWDNSPISASQEYLSEVLSIVGDFNYFSSPENLSLSKVYNRIVNEFSGDYFMLLDQDSTLDRTHFKVLSNTISENPKIKLFLPSVLNGIKLVSPGQLVFFKGKHWKKKREGLIKSENILAITSGMVISNDSFIINSCYFDERLTLYGIDTKFMLDFSKIEKYIYVLPLSINHNTVLWSNPSVDVMLVRFNNLKKSWSIVFSSRPFARILARIYSVYLSVKYSYKYKDVRFLKNN